MCICVHVCLCVQVLSPLPLPARACAAIFNASPVFQNPTHPTQPKHNRRRSRPRSRHCRTRRPPGPSATASASGSAWPACAYARRTACTTTCVSVVLLGIDVVGGAVVVAAGCMTIPLLNLPTDAPSLSSVHLSTHHPNHCHPPNRRSTSPSTSASSPCST